NLRFDDGTPVRQDWHRINTTLFNGASNISQTAGLAVLDPEGMQAVERMSAYYMENATRIKRALEEMGYACFGGVNAPYVWVQFPGRDSWEVFSDLLENAHVVT